MNIFGIGGAELVVIILIALVVAGPKRMAVWAYHFGKFVGKLRKQWEQVAEVLQKEMESAGVDVQVPKELPTRQNITKMVSQALKPAMDEVDKAAKEVQKTVNPLKSDLQTIEHDVNQNLKLSSQVKKPAAKPASDTPATESPAPSLGTWGETGSAAPASSGTPVSNGSGGMGTWSNPESSDNP